MAESSNHQFNEIALDDGFEALAGAAEFCFCIGHGQFHDLADFFEALFVEVKQGDDARVVGRKLGDGTLERSVAVAAFEGKGSIGRAFVGQSDGLFFVIERNYGWVDFPQVVECGGIGDFVQPSREFALAPEVGEVAKGTEETVLGHLVRVLAVADKAQGERENVLFVAFHEHGERALPPADGLLNQCLVRNRVRHLIWFSPLVCEGRTRASDAGLQSRKVFFWEKTGNKKQAGRLASSGLLFRLNRYEELAYACTLSSLMRAFLPTKPRR